MALQPSCSSSHKYNVFLSFRGSDTRHGFTGNLYKTLHDKGIHTFIDDEELQSGEEIKQALKNAIEESKVAIIILSTNYATSSFCLDELAYILECRETKNMLVLPVFYEVEPSDVRYQRGSFGEAWEKHEERLKHNMEKLQKWKNALQQVSNLSGYHFKQRDVYEYKFIQSIVGRVLDAINHPGRLSVPDHLVGLESPKAEIMKLLDVGSDDGIHIVGIHGMGGIGKSTLARVVYNDLLAKKKFEGSCYLENLREESNRHGLKHLQSILLQELLGDKNINLASVSKGASMIEDRLRLKKVLLVLDDVDKDDQLKTIVGSPDWFGPGSRVIITTRDEQLLKSREVKRRYEVKELYKNDALRLLTWNAFKKDEADPTYEDDLNHVVTYASGLPLALEVIGSNLFGKTIEEWKSAIDQYKRIPHSRIQDILKVSFDGLEYEEKSVFLDITCCLKGLAGVEDKLCAHYGHNMKNHIKVLVGKSLIKLDHLHDTITMHDLIEDMGKEIVRQESPDELGKRSRIWSHEDIIAVLEENTGTSEIKMICLEFPKFSEVVVWDGDAFKGMRNLKTLIMKNGNFSEGPKCLPNSLRVLEWWGYPSKYLPSDFRPKKLAICALPYSSIESFKLNGLLKMFEDLKVLNFDECKCLTEIPDVSGFPNVEELSFKYCDNLVTVHESIGFLNKLKILSAYGCEKLGSFPPIELTPLENLELSFCKNLENFPEILGEMENIRKLELECTSIKALPLSFKNLIGLQSLTMGKCGIVQFPSSILKMPQLTSIQIWDLEGWQWLMEEEGEEKTGSAVSSNVKNFSAVQCNLNDDFFSAVFPQLAHVEYLGLSGNNFTFLPECIKEFKSLQHLEVNNCKHLRDIRGVPPSIRFFNAKDCESLTSSSSSMFINQGSYKAGTNKCCLPGAWLPEWFDLKSEGPSNSFWFRNKFPAKVLFLFIAPVKYEFRELDCPEPIVFINGKPHGSPMRSNIQMVRTKMDHTYFSYLQMMFFGENVYDVPLEKEWNHAKITYAGVIESTILTATGIHLFKQESRSEDIRFDDPDCEEN